MERPPAPAPAASQLPPGHPPLDGAPADDGSADARFAGTLRLRGELAAQREGFVMLSVKPEGVRMPCYSRKYAVAEASPEDGGLRLDFELGPESRMGKIPPGGIVLEARFDPDGMVESKEGVVLATMPIQVGATDAEIVLGG